MNARSKKARSTRPKSFNSWRLVNPPSGFHKVPLAPRQGFNVILGDPSDKRPEGEIESKWVVRLTSDLMTYDGMTLDKANREVHHFYQKYDLDNCSLPTCDLKDTVSLGSIFVAEKDNPKGDGKEANLLLHIPRSNGESICVVDPADEYVQIFPHSKLKVIITEPLAESKIDWEFEDDPYDANLKLASLGNGIQILSDLWNPCPNACLNSNFITLVREEKKKVYAAKYFEFALNKESAKISATMKPGHVLMTRLVFTGKEDGRDATRRIVNVVLCIPKERKTYKTFPAFATEKTTEPKVVVSEPVPENPLARREEKVLSLNTIINPGDQEGLELTPADPKICIQLPLPKSVYPGRPQNARWRVGIEGNQSKLNITSCPDQDRWGHTFQVVTAEISPTHVPESGSSGFVGAVLLTIDADDTGPPVNRRISVWYTRPHGKSGQAYSGSSHGAYSGAYVRSHEDKIKRTGEHTRRQTDYTKAAVCTDLVIEKIESKSFLDGLKTINFASLATPVSPPPSCSAPHVTRKRSEPGHHHNTYNPQNMGGKVASYEQTANGRVYYDLANNDEVQLPASSTAILRMPFREVNGSLCCWAVKILDDKLIKIVDIKSSITGNSHGCMEVTVQGNLASDIVGSASGGIIVFSSGSDTRTIRVRVVSASSRTYFPEIPLKLGRTVQARKVANFSVVRAFQNHDSVTISPTDMLYVKIPSFMDGFTVSVDLAQKPLPPGVTMDYQTKELINPNCVWYPTGFPAILNRAAVLRRIAEINPAWPQILKCIKNKNQPIHVADLIFRGVSNNDVSVESAFGDVRQMVHVSKTIHVMMIPDMEAIPSGKQVCGYAPEDNTELKISAGDDVSIVLKAIKSDNAEEWEWPWYYIGASNEGVQWVKLEKINRDYFMKFKAKNRPESGRTTVTFGVHAGKGQSRKLNVHLVFQN